MDAGMNRFYTGSIERSIFFKMMIGGDMRDKPRKKHRVLKVILIFLLILLIAAGGAAFWLYQKFSDTVGELNYRELESDELQINPQVKDDEKLQDYTNIALFGLDSREGNLEQANSDTIIIASINNDTKEIKMVSVYRDTYLNIGNDMYRKANAAYANGGPEWAVNMLNTNLDLDITEFVSVDFNALVDLIDAVGGIEITVDDEECDLVNGYCVETSQVTGKSYEDLPGAGTYLMNGVQAVSYTRIRYTSGNDFKRTERQREVIGKIVSKIKTLGIGELMDLAHTMFPMVLTSFSEGELIKLGMSVLSYSMGTSTGFPFAHRTSASDYNEVPVTLESNVIQLHEYLFGDSDYQPSQEVINRSQAIINATGYDDASQASTENFTTGE